MRVVQSSEWLTGFSTGMKCLPSNKLPLAQGNALHDWHAEVVAIRAFNRFLLDQCLLSATSPHLISDWIRQRPIDEHNTHERQPFTIQEDVSIHMYCSEAPCGDASMELVMDAQDDATPWTSAPPTISSTDETDSALRGRSNFSLLGAVRCKPSRPDAPPTLSKSCTDKIALKQATSLLSSTTSLLISPRNAYLHSLTLPASQYVPQACTRAFSRSGRLKDLSDEAIAKWKGGYRWRQFKVDPTTREFTWSRRRVSSGEKAVASNLSAAWTPSWQETLIGGVLQGRKQFDPRGASAICRRSVWKSAVQVAALVGLPVVLEALSKKTYTEVKSSPDLTERRTVKKDISSILKGWLKNTGDENFNLNEQ